MQQLSGRTALVTGASGNLAIYLAQALARQGMNLVLADKEVAGLEDVTQQLRAAGTKVLPVTADVADWDDAGRLVAEADREFGGIDVLVNNAAIEIRRPYQDVTVEQIEGVMRVNLVAPMVLTRLVLPGMVQRRRGHIVNMSSLAGKVGAIPYYELYVTSKAGLISFTQCLRSEFRATGVSASVICPGFVDVEGVYHKYNQERGAAAHSRVGTSTTEEVADAVVKAIQRDLAEIIVNPRSWGIRALVGFLSMFPSAREPVNRMLGINDLFERTVREQMAAAEE
jgi:short-subunit dehydrogenase